MSDSIKEISPNNLEFLASRSSSWGKISKNKEKEDIESMRNEIPLLHAHIKKDLDALQEIGNLIDEALENQDFDKLQELNDEAD